MMVCLMVSPPWHVLNNLLYPLPCFFIPLPSFLPSFLQVLITTISPPSLLMSSSVSPPLDILVSHLISLFLRQFHHLPVFALHYNSLTSLPSGVFNHLTSLASLYPTSPSHFLLTPISCSIIIEQQPSCLPPIWTVLKSQQTHLSLLPSHQSPLFNDVYFPFINQFPLSFTFAGTPSLPSLLVFSMDSTVWLIYSIWSSLSFPNSPIFHF